MALSENVTTDSYVSGKEVGRGRQRGRAVRSGAGTKQAGQLCAPTDREARKKFGGRVRGPARDLQLAAPRTRGPAAHAPSSSGRGGRGGRAAATGAAWVGAPLDSALVEARVLGSRLALLTSERRAERGACSVGNGRGMPCSCVTERTPECAVQDAMIRSPGATCLDRCVLGSGEALDVVWNGGKDKA